MTEEETLKHIYDNNLFEKMDEIIDKNPVYIYPLFKEPKEKYEDELEENLEDEDDWELEQ